MRRTVLLAHVIAALTAPFIWSGDVSAAPPPPAAAPVGGLYVGYYQEDPLTNPEDPTPGAFTLNLPAGDAGFSGSMFFTYVGCQTSNVGAISGKKAGATLSGTWSGTIDGSPQSGSYIGTYNANIGAYAGTYTNAGGKQFRDLSPCISYWIAPNGSWEMFPADLQVPSTFDVSVTARRVGWAATNGAALTLVYLLDPTIAQGSGNPVLWQTLVAGATTSIGIPSTVKLQNGKTYVAAVHVSDASAVRLAFGSRSFKP